MSAKAYIVYPIEWNYKIPIVQTYLREFDTEEEAINHMKTAPMTDLQFILVKFEVNVMTGMLEGKGKVIGFKSSKSGDIVGSFNNQGAPNK